MIEVSVEIKAPIAAVWEAWINPSHIVNWYFASHDWCCPRAQLDCRVGGTFSIRMEAKDKSFGFDFNATFTKVLEEAQLNYTLEDGRLVDLVFTQSSDSTLLTWCFEPENQNPEDLQRQGWQAILNNFKLYLEQSGD